VELKNLQADGSIVDPAAAAEADTDSDTGATADAGAGEGSEEATDRQDEGAGA